jgi:hypothetical protein
LPYHLAVTTTFDTLARLVDGLDPDVTSTSPWTLAQALAHCAQSIEYSLTGYPRLRSGLFRATIGPLAKRKFIRAGRMKHDVTAPVAGAPDLPATLSFGDARERIRAAMTAFTAHTGPLAPHLAYGACTKDEYATLHLLHVEDHLRAFGVGLSTVPR